MPAAPVIQFRKETVAGFEQRVSLLRATTTREAVIKGNQATFLVASSGGRGAVTRGDNGDLPYGQPNNVQRTVTLVEKHGTHEETGFNMFASQGDQFGIMQESAMTDINIDVDKVIIAALATATQTAGVAATGSVAVVTKAMAILGAADVDTDNPDDLFAVVTPAMRAYLMQTAQFSSGDYVDSKPFAGATRKIWRWAGFNWIVSTKLPGAGTSSATCFFFHRSALGHAVNIGEENIDADYESKHDRSWARVTLYHNALLLQNAGVVKVLHDDSAMVAS
ncbi:phage capsid protein [Neorhizobium sp. AL 9.2.2]|jgi:hypothetical protein|uniref:phage capsid protein n=1 Tax=Neorhizobium sp. AL 9.2.2 TaxID=2712894 RepID=UPI001573B857|nr:phage capsid protein [Neorhizobium sp. AL 9.2.2]NSY17260.1 hypothetical protein [Neorhizobium sp. AL 9.2.2]